MTDRKDDIAATAGVESIDAGAILTRSVEIYRQNFAPFTLIMAIVTAPEIVLDVLVNDAAIESASPGRLLFLGLGVIAIAMALSFVGSGAIIFGVFRQLRDGRSAGPRETLARGLGTLLPVIGVAIASALLVTAGILLLVVPGVILAVSLYVAVPVAVVERRGVNDSISRSLDLTKGNRWRIFALMFVLGVVNGGLDWLLRILFLSERSGFDGWPWYLGLSSAVSIVLGAVSAVAAALVYYQIKVGKEGADADALAAIFD